MFLNGVFLLKGIKLSYLAFKKILFFVESFKPISSWKIIMTCYLQRVRQVPASFTEKKLLLLRIISSLDVILLTGLYGEESELAGAGALCISLPSLVLFPVPPTPHFIPDREICGVMVYSLPELCWLEQSLISTCCLKVYFTFGLAILPSVPVPRQGIGDKGLGRGLLGWVQEDLKGRM